MIEEVPVKWQEIQGGSLFIVSATISFFKDYIGLFFFYNTGIWIF
jgi:hypothetical protein